MQTPDRPIMGRYLHGPRSQAAAITPLTFVAGSIDVTARRARLEPVRLSIFQSLKVYEQENNDAAHDAIILRRVAVMNLEESAGAPRFDANPVLPSEAGDLPTHVDQCARRYVALLQYLNLLSRRMRGVRIESWIYRAITLPVMLWIAFELYRLRYGG